MPKPSIKVKLSEADKAFIYRMIRKLTFSLPIRDRIAVLRLAVRFTPGNAAMYLTATERQVIVLWLTKLYKVARVRDQKIGARIENVLKTISACT